MHECLVPMIPRLTLGGPEGEPHGETATSAMTGEATFSCKPFLEQDPNATKVDIFDNSGPCRRVHVLRMNCANNTTVTKF